MSFSYWSRSSSELFALLHSTEKGLSADEAEALRKQFERQRLKPPVHISILRLLVAQFITPLILILLAAAAVAFVLEDRTDTTIILLIVVASGLLGFFQEYGASRAVETLLTAVRTKADVLRDGGVHEIAARDVVPGDIVILQAGDMIPADCSVLESKALFVDEATLTGETYPVEKQPGILPQETLLANRTNCVFYGTHVVSGTGKALAVRIGRHTEFGHIAAHLRLRPPETEFERGLRRFGYFLMEVTLALVMVIFALNVWLQRPVLDSLLFSLALAVGLTPQLLPAIVSITLSHGARRMADRRVIVKRLSSIENLGSMTVLCSDKTGTLTEGKATVRSAVDIYGQPSRRVLTYAYLNSTFETGFRNPIDDAIRASSDAEIAGYLKLDELPYDFVRKRLSILVTQGDDHLMITKGAVKNVLEICTAAEKADGIPEAIEVAKPTILAAMTNFSADGYRTIAIAYRGFDSRPDGIDKSMEAGMTFLGFIVLEDPLKPGIMTTLRRLTDMGIAVKIITGDSRLVAAHVGAQVGLGYQKIVTGNELRHMGDQALLRNVDHISLFAEVEPNQKERIILALKKAGHVVGYSGDGINDATALHTADVGISVDGAVDVAKEAADIVLLEKDLDILVEGVKEGRRTIANTLKYVFMATSANFGNMFSMAGASVFLSFLPLLPHQILLTNLLTDIPEMTIATDQVDHELVQKPRRWDITFIRKFMLSFGALSSIFDFFTFAILLLALDATVQQFRTGWFVESVISACIIVLVIRTERPIFTSPPSKPMLIATGLVIMTTLAMSYLPFTSILEFTALPPIFMAAIGVIVSLYVLVAELIKKKIYRCGTL
jgi:Mg2+-importing ATPase